MTPLHLHLFRAGALSIVVVSSLASGSDAALSADGCAIGINCIPNATFVESTGGSTDMPDNWATDVFGRSDAAFTITSGRTDHASATVVVTRHDEPADAKWVFNEIPVMGGQYFTFSDWYKSTASSEVYAYFHGGTQPYDRLAILPPSVTPETWTELRLPGFFVPTGATAMTVSHVLVGNGSLTTDDYSLMLKPAPVFRRGLVSLAFDDAWKAIYVNAIPILDRAGLKSTQYINTDPVVLSPGRYATNMTIDDLLSMQSKGHEIGAHTRSHRDLVEDIKDDDERRSEVDGSRTDLLGAGIATVDTFAYPFGRYDDRLREIVKDHFIAARTTDIGFNTTDVDRFALKSQLVVITTTPAEVREWTEYAIAHNLWLVLTIHRVERTLAECAHWVTKEADPYCTDTATLQAIVDYLGGLPAGTVRTVHDVVSDDSLWVPAPAPADTSTAPIGDDGATEEALAPPGKPSESTSR